MAGIINNLRARAGLVGAAVLLALVALLLSDALSNLGNLQSDPNTVAVIGDHEITVAEFSQEVERLRREQIQSGMDEITPELEESIRQQAWANLKYRYINRQAWEEMGLGVTQEELNEIWSGDHISSLVKQQFAQGGAMPSNQQVQAQIRQIMQQAKEDPEMQARLNRFRDQLVKNRVQEKFNTLVQAALKVSTAEAKRAWMDQNTRMNFDFLAVNYGALPDSLVEVSESDYRDYYREHKEEYRQEKAQTFIQYVTFPRQATAADSAKLREELTRLRQEFAQIESPRDDSIYAGAKSDERLPAKLQLPDSIAPDLAQRTDSLQPGQVTDIYLKNGYYRVTKVSQRLQLPQDRPRYRVSHLFLVRDSTQEDSAQFAQRLQQIYSQLQQRPMQFPAFVQQISMDEASKDRGGDLGWQSNGWDGDSLFGFDFDSLRQTAPDTSDILPPFQSEFGYHIVRITDTTTRLARLATINILITPSSETEEALQREAGLFQAKVAGKSIELFDTLARQEGYRLRSSNALTGENAFISGIEDPNSILRWALDEKHDIGNVSDVLETEEAYVVAQIKERLEEGYPPLEKVKEQLRPFVYNRKKAQYIINKLGQAQEKTLEGYEQAFGQGAYRNSSQGATFQGRSIPGVGNDPLLQGQLLQLAEGQISKPIEGRTGVYVVKVTKLEQPEAPDSAAVASQRQQMQQQRQAQVTNRFLQALQNKPEVVDRRYQFNLN